MAGGSEKITSSEYISHHLQNLTFGKHPEHGWSFAHSAADAQAMGFWAFHVDTLFWSLLLGLVFYGLFRRVAKQANSGVPSRFQAFIESIVEFVDSSVRDTFHGTSRLIAPLALTLFVWIFFMNFMDLIPVDWLPWVATQAGVDYQKVVPTTDVNATMGMAIAVFVLIIIYSVRFKGVGGFLGCRAVDDTFRFQESHEEVCISLGGGMPIVYGLRSACWYASHCVRDCSSVGAFPRAVHNRYRSTSGVVFSRRYRVLAAGKVGWNQGRSGYSM